MSEETVIHRRAVSWWAAARVALLAGWVLWAALSWWMAPRESTVAQAQAAIEAGRMVSYQTGGSWQDDAWAWGAVWGPGPVSDDGSHIRWETTDLRRHYAAVSGDDGQAAELARTLDGARLATGWFEHVPALVGMMSAAAVLIFLVVLVTGPAPVTGTRWFWFWLVAGAPFGLGLVYWLARERPWSRTATRPPGPADRDPRRRWYLGLGLAIVVSLAASVLTFGLAAL